MKPMYLALDFPDWQETEWFIRSNELQGVPVKVGMELFYREGPPVIEKLKGDGHSIFLDLKLHDIPNTVYKAMKNLAKLGVDLVNVHAWGGSEMIRAAKQGFMEGNLEKNSRLIAVTVLTSMDNRTLSEELHIPVRAEESVLNLAMMAKESGADGVVCSPWEVPSIKKNCGSSFYTVTPGIRLKTDQHQDQQRTASPTDARDNGADAIVIGRSVTASTEPKSKYQQIIKEWKDDDER
ncbi:orotidine-5'-phosphate decarboxylase [Sediminibacillus dalangtanensis]|uniref:Orotidine 5'-phosphate decarboxylase n=1 Tax=Sediminibacillus dalangtanensis TaxID=2729421 RepID=A0ABX7VV67_9BACI|nr:orotidine-5'-phosphate decarboxylase [Sediminibacillus dalangtanensis]QTM99358.1 orotidine-5'-phosphate decarboxylase [Sediminibacillus dalangtanensis]